MELPITACYMTHPITCGVTKMIPLFGCFLSTSLFVQGLLTQQMWLANYRLIHG